MDGDNGEKQHKDAEKRDGTLGRSKGSSGRAENWVCGWKRGASGPLVSVSSMKEETPAENVSGIHGES